MKKLFTLLILITTFASIAQAPQGFNYQAVLRNANGTLLVNQNTNIKFNIMLNTQTSAPIYSEIHNALTDDLGQVSLVVGTGTVTTGAFASINWSNGTYFLGIEVNKGAGYIAMGTTQLLSVPFALFAQNAQNSYALPNGINVGDVLTWNGSQWGSAQSTASNLPVVTTVNASAINGNSAVGGGLISSNGGFNITAKGVCWTTNLNPTISDNTTNNGSGSANFTSNFTNLSPGATYYYRAYATNVNGTSYGTIFSFTTLNFPSMETVAPINIARIYAYSGANFISDGGSAVIEKGLVWGTMPNPTIALPTKTTEGGGLINFTRKITGLSEKTTYYLRAYATNAVGTSYGNQIVFATTDMDGIYTVIQGEYWRINVPRPDVVWTGQTRVIEFVSSNVNATTYRFLEYCGFFGPGTGFPDNTHYFNVDASDVVRTPVIYNGVAQILNDMPVINCEETPSNITNACANTPNNTIVRDDVNGRDRIYRSYGYLNTTGPREFYEVLERLVD